MSAIHSKPFVDGHPVLTSGKTDVRRADVEKIVDEFPRAEPASFVHVDEFARRLQETPETQKAGAALKGLTDAVREDNPDVAKAEIVHVGMQENATEAQVQAALEAAKDLNDGNPFAIERGKDGVLSLPSGVAAKVEKELTEAKPMSGAVIEAWSTARSLMPTLPQAFEIISKAK